jgi:hypothetical protein
MLKEEIEFYGSCSAQKCRRSTTTNRIRCPRLEESGELIITGRGGEGEEEILVYYEVEICLCFHQRKCRKKSQKFANKIIVQAGT